MNICNITFEVPRLSTFVFKKSSEKNIFTIIFVGKSLKGFGWSNVGTASQRVAHGVICVVAFRGIKRRCTRMAVRANTGQSPNSISMLGQRQIRLTGMEAAMSCDAGPTLNRYWVDKTTLFVPGTSFGLVH